MVIDAKLMISEVRYPCEQILKSQQGADLFIEGEFVANHVIDAQIFVVKTCVVQDILNIVLSSMTVSLSKP